MNEIVNTEKIRASLQHFLTHGFFHPQYDDVEIPDDYRGAPLVVATRQNVIDLLSRYIQDDWEEEDVGSWCRCVSSPYRKYIAYEAGYGYIIDDVVSQWETFWEESLTPQNATEDIIRLQNAKHDPNDRTP